MTPHNQPITPGELPGKALMRLRREGMTVREAANRIGISERQAYRMMKEFAADPSRFERWSPSLETDGAPEKTRWLFETCEEGGWMVEEADIAWALHCACEELDTLLIKAFCRLYLSAAGGPPTERSRHRLIIDRALWYRAWESEDAAGEFAESIPVVNAEELRFAAEVTWYLRRHVARPGGSSLKARTVVSGVDDRRAFFNKAIEEISEAAEQRMASAVLNRRIEPVRVPKVHGEMRGK